ncbi:hypothetical protein FACS1894176_07350 [Bacteroidia bacterium]|nr:hypothetical protein FACS1894176_07350 [Bacteroidia bacterium]
MEGEVDTSKSGKYEITYSIEVDDVDEAGKPIKKKQEKIRIVEVVEIPDDKLDIILNGDDPMEVKKGETFVDPGATATLGGKRIPDEEIEIAIKNKNT